MLQTKTIIFFILVIILSSKADVLFVKNAKPIFGQLLRIEDKNILFERIDPQSKMIVEIFIPARLVEKAVDESGTILFNAQTRKDNLATYYRPIINNWEEIKYYYADSLKDYIRLKNGRIIEGLILSVQELSIFIDSGIKKGDVIDVKKIDLDNVDRVNQTEVIIATGKKPKPKQYRYNINLGTSLNQTKFDRLSKILETNFPDEKIKKRNKLYGGIDLSLKAWLSTKIAIGLGVQLFASSNNQVFMSDVFVSYRFKTGKFKPLISAGLSGINFFSDEQFSSDEKIEIDLGQTGGFISSAIEWDFSDQYAFYSSISYYAFGKKTIRGEEINLQNSQLDLSLWRIAAGLRFAF